MVVMVQLPELCVDSSTVMLNNVSSRFTEIFFIGRLSGNARQDHDAKLLPDLRIKKKIFADGNTKMTTYVITALAFGSFGFLIATLLTASRDRPHYRP